MYNSHVHSLLSHDGKASFKQMCDAALSSGLKGIAFTDHCDLEYYISDNVYSIAKKSTEEVKKQKEVFGKSLKVLAGVELSGVLNRMEYARQFTSFFDFDVVLLSVHSVTSGGKTQFLSRMDFSLLSNEDIMAVLKSYFDELIKTLSTADFDVCAHLTLPFRYINGVYNRNISPSLFIEDIKKVLSILIERGKALELNTSEINHQLYDFMPDKSILKLYHDMGGRLITIGSDAHLPQNLALGFDCAFTLLKECGFESYCYYAERRCVCVPF